MYEFVKIESPKNPVTEAYITEVEKTYGVQFPVPLREYFLEYNGQQITSVKLQSNELVYKVRKITQLKDPSLSLEQLLRDQRLQDFPARQMIPIADDRANGLYYLHTGNDMVYYSDLEGEDDFTPICKGIDRFFQLLDEACRLGEGAALDISEEFGSEAPTAHKQFLPLGSVVGLQGANRKVFIISRGLNVNRDDDTYFYDYGGVAYPDGLVNGEIVYFNDDGINRVYFHGYSDAEDETFLLALRAYLDEHPNINYGKPYQ